MFTTSCNASTSVLAGTPGSLFGSRWRLALQGKQNHRVGQKPSDGQWIGFLHGWPVFGDSIQKANETSTDVPVAGARGAEKQRGGRQWPRDSRSLF